MSLIGSLDEFKIADVLRLFASSRKTGLLTVAARGGQQALIHFQRGAILHASAGRLHGEDAVLDLFGWKEGQLTFVPDDRAVTPNVARSLEALVDEGLRVGDRLHRMRAMVPTDHAVFQLGPGPSNPETRYAVGALEWKVLRLLDGVRDITEVVAESDLPREEVVNVVFEMAEAGYLERVDVQRTLKVQLQRPFAKFSLLGPEARPEEAADLDTKVQEEWRKVTRFAEGVLRVELQTHGGKSAALGANFQPNLGRVVLLPRNAMSALGLREGDDVHVRPIG
jgi:hypothetical protein